MLASPEVAPRAAGSRSEFRRVVDEHVVPHADRWDVDGRLPAGILELVAEQGWWGAPLDASHGGAGMDWVTVGALHEEVGRGCSSLRSLLTVHTMVLSAIERWADADARDRWLGPLAAGELLGAFCLTEPGAGSDAAAIATAAAERGGELVLDGTKLWVTGGQVAGLFLVFARHGEGVSAVLVPAGADGVEVVPIEGALGTRASMLARVELRGCRVPRAAVIGPPGLGIETVATAALDIGRYSVACGSVGIVRACLEASARHAAARVHRSGPLKDQPLIRRMLSDMVVDAEAGRLLCEHAGRLKDQRDPATIMATWTAKYHASCAAARAAADTVQIHGASGCAEGHPAGRFYRDAKVMEIIEGSTELQQTTIAEQAFRGATWR